MAQDKDYVHQLGQTVFEMHSNGESDPSAAEIAERHFDGKALGGEIVEGVRKRLGKIRDFLEHNYPEHPVCLVSQTYYVRFRDNLPKTTADARKCLPVGHGKSQEGIRFCSGEDDLIWQEHVAINMGQGAGKIRAGTDRATLAHQNNMLSAESGARILDRAGRIAEPSQPEIAAKLMEAIPAGDGDVEVAVETDD